ARSPCAGLRGLSRTISSVPSTPISLRTREISSRSRSTAIESSVQTTADGPLSGNHRSKYGGAARTDAAAAGAATPSGRCSGWWFNRPEIFVQSLVELDFASEPLDLLELLDLALSEPPFSEPAA